MKQINEKHLVFRAHQILPRKYHGDILWDRPAQVREAEADPEGGGVDWVASPASSGSFTLKIRR